MSFGYCLLPKAEQDLDGIADSIADHAGLELGLRFLGAAFKQFSLLATQPDMGWPCKLNHRDFKNARVFRVEEPFAKYLIFYIPTKSQVEILRILHGAQDLETRFEFEGAF